MVYGGGGMKSFPFFINIPIQGWGYTINYSLCRDLICDRFILTFIVED